MNFHVIASGSKGNASVVYDEHTTILVDMGISKSLLESGLKEINRSISAIDYALFTHDHSDHIKGIGFIPFEKRYARKGTTEILKANYLKAYQRRKFGTFEVVTLLTSHDAVAPCGFIFENNNEKLVYITDTGLLPIKTYNLLKNADFYYFESNFDKNMLLNSKRPKYLIKRIEGEYGHLSNEESAEYLSSLIGENTKKIILAHLSLECNKPDIAIKTYSEVFNRQNVSLDNKIIICSKQFESVDL